MRILIAAINGLLAFFFGLGVGTTLIHYAGLGRLDAYVLQNVVSTQVSFLLARFVTWRDRRVPFFRTLLRYNGQQLTTVILSIVLFTVLTKIGMYYAAANFTVTVAVAPLTFLIAHNWSIAERHSASSAPASSAPRGKLQGKHGR
ncbi:MAG: GtrA family protein [Trebonia sp.]